MRHTTAAELERAPDHARDHDDELVATLERIAVDLERLPYLAVIIAAMLALLVIAGTVVIILTR